MYNAEKPSIEELPSPKQLVSSTLIALGVALVILTTVILPAEYDIDPTGIGGVIGLGEMGAIKADLAEEAAQDAAAGEGNAPAAPVIILNGSSDRESSLIDRVFDLIAPPAHAGAGHDHGAQPASPSVALMAETAPDWSDELSFTLTPGQGIEIKLVMNEGATAYYAWDAGDGIANFDLHGDNSGGQSISYTKGRGVPGDNGALVAAFSGNHGWFWRNRMERDITITLRVAGDYVRLKLPR